MSIEQEYPFTLAKWNDTNQRYEDNPVVGKCPKCGIEFRKVMWYSCSRNDCPVFKKAILK